MSPAVALTSKIPSSIDSNDTSKVPPPKSKINTFDSWFFTLSRPYAIAAAVGSLIIRKIFKPAIAPASFVAWRCESLKYAGTVTTASFTDLPRNASPISFIFVRIIEDTSSAENCLVSPLWDTSIIGLSFLSGVILYDNSSLSFFTCSSEYFRPIKRFASYTVFSGFNAAWFLAASPISLSVSVNATYDGVVLFPWSLATISHLPFCHTPTHEYVVPKSIPKATILIKYIYLFLSILYVIITSSFDK